MAILEDIQNCVLDGELDEIKDLVQKAVNEGIDPAAIITTASSAA